MRVLRLVKRSVDSAGDCGEPRIAIPDGEDLTELRDISSMAMDHFDEQIVGLLGVPGGRRSLGR